MTGPKSSPRGDSDWAPGEQSVREPTASKQTEEKQAVAEQMIAEQAAFPVAEVREARSVTSALFLRSRFWWLTVVCFFVAFWLTWESIPSVGPTITIRFPNGHGLKAGDVVRHRGIEAGVVDSVELSDDLSQITATVTLTPGASGLAREGARFWIVRPQLSLAGVSGLETAVGAKYIGVSPGDPEGRRQSQFEGLAAAPPDENSGEGIDIVLRSDARHGVSVGAPITWRGVDVGQILSINLSPDARFVDVHARINAEYTRLLRKTSTFWVTSGIGIDVGLSGVRLNADSLSTIVRGGVSFATPAVSLDKSPLKSGHMFVLHDKPDPEWLNAASSLPLIEFDLPPTVTVHGIRKTSLLGIPRSQKFSVNGLMVLGQRNAARILTVSDVLPSASEPSASETPAASVELQVSSAASESTFTINAVPGVDATSSNDGTDSAAGYLWLPCHELKDGFPAVKESQLRNPLGPEECCLCRSVRTDDETSSVIQSIGIDQLKGSAGVWTVTMDAGDLSPWHGAPVVSMADGKVIGVFATGKTGATIIPLKPEPQTEEAARHAE